MFTVLIAEKEHIDAIRQENKLFFEPFLDNKELAFCYWNPAGQSLQDSVPGLLDAVGRRREWRAVIINNASEETLKTRNPFDVVDNSAIAALTLPHSQPESEEPYDRWMSEWETYYKTLAKEKEVIYNSAMELPLQKLSTWLCFTPEDYILHDVQEKQDIFDWAMKELGDGELKASSWLEKLERDHYKYEQRLKEQIRREFLQNAFLNVAQPKEVHCITLRTAETSFFDPDNYWTVRRDCEYSAFADRNMYFDKMRFLVFDLLPRSHRNFRTDYIRFMAAVLIFISNPVPASAMQARRLYSLETETDDTPLCILVTSYDKKLANTAEIIECEMDKIRNEIPADLTDKAAEELFCKPRDIAVVLDDSGEPEKIFVDKDYGLFFDHPENEYHKWNRDYKESEKALAHITKQQTRSIRKSVTQTHMASELHDVNVSRLTPLQVEDVREFTDAAEDEMVASIPRDLTDSSLYKQQLAEASENVKKMISRRMTRKTVAILTGICLFLYMLCFLPFLANKNSTPENVTTALIFIGAMLALVLIILLICLFFLRRSMIRSVKDYNNVCYGIMADIQDSLRRFAKYLSTMCNVRRGHAVQNYAQKNTDDYTKGLSIRKRHQEDIRKMRAYLAEDYQEYFADRSYCDETMARPYDYDFDQKTEYAYPAPFLAGDCRQIEFVSSGNFVTVPSSYVTRMLVRMEGIYENSR